MSKIKVFENAHVLTMDTIRPRASCVIVRDDRIMSLDPCDIPRDAVRVDCQGKTIIPGLIDTHIHLHAYAKKVSGNDLSLLDDLTIAKTRDYIGGLCQKAAPGEWITIFGYDPYRIAEKRFLTRWDIDEVSADNPIRMYHRSGHGQLCNSKALELMDIDISSEDPDGGLIDREVPSGEPSGMLYGMDDFISSFVPSVKGSDMRVAAAAAGKLLAQEGITCVHDATLRNSFERLETLEAWHDQGLIPQRMRCMIGIDEFLIHRGDLSELSKDHPSFHGVKLILDEIRGRLNIDREILKDYFIALEEASVPGMIHCVDEIQLEAAVEAIEAAKRACPGKGVRHRIEHASLCDDAMISRLSKLGVFVSSQPAFLYYSGERYLDTIVAEDVSKLYRFASLMKAGINVSFSSDAPIAPVDPFKGVYSAVTRKSEKGGEVAPCEKSPIMSALEAYTINAARAMRMDNAIGSLAPGKQADMVFVDKDPLSCDESELKDIEVEMTVIGGDVVWHVST